MAGYVFAIGKDSNPKDMIRRFAETGVYSTHLNSLSQGPFEGTLADYMSMKAGDNIYFFCERKYYGVGELISVGLDCKYCNFPNSTKMINFDYDSIRDDLLVDYGANSQNYRWICTFKGDPFFFEEGIDTDEILVYKPSTFKMLRAFWGLSFIKLGDEENNSLKEIFLLRRQKETQMQIQVFSESNKTHENIKKHDLNRYMISPDAMLRLCANETKVKHEMALEATVVYDLCHDNIPMLGHCDYVSHQVVASPFKPIQYMDKIDVFAARYLPGTKLICKYLVVELKKDTANKDTINQVLKYVDWVCREYAYGDYEMVEACIIAAVYENDISNYYRKVVQRYYTLGSHPVRNKQWSALKLLRYSYENGSLNYIDETPTFGDDT